MDEGLDRKPGGDYRKALHKAEVRRRWVSRHGLIEQAKLFGLYIFLWQHQSFGPANGNAQGCWKSNLRLPSVASAPFSQPKQAAGVAEWEGIRVSAS